MKNTNKFYKLSKFIPLGFLLLGITSCTTGQFASVETDGIYYNPETDTRATSYEEVTYQDTYTPSNQQEKSLVRIGGKYFDTEGTAPTYEEKSSTHVREYSNDYLRKRKHENRYSTWGEEDENVNVSVNFYGSPYYSGFGWGVGYQWGTPFDWGYAPYSYWQPYGYYGYGWGNPYRFYNPYYSPYYGFGYGYGYYGSPYWGGGYYGNPYYYGGGAYYPNYYGGNVQRVERGKGMNSNVRLERGSTHSNTDNQRSERLRRGYYNNNNYSNERTNNNSTYTPQRRTSDYGTRPGQRVRRQESTSQRNNSYTPSRTQQRSNWNTSPSRGSWNSSPSRSSGSTRSSGTRIRR